MQLRNKRLVSEQGSDSIFKAEDMFLETNPETGIISATILLDSLSTMTTRRLQKEAAMWERLRTGTAINGILVPRKDRDDKVYLWIQFDLPRGIEQHKVMIHSDRMVDFFRKYQTAEVTVRFTLQNLIDEATRIENGGSNRSTPISKFPYQSKEFGPGEKGNDDESKSGVEA